MLKPLNLRRWYTEFTMPATAAQANYSHPHCRIKMPTTSQQYDSHQQADTQSLWQNIEEPAHQGWAQPNGSRLWHYYRVTGEFTENETSLCGAWDSAGVEAADLFDKNHGCADHCKACQRRRA